MRSRKTRTIAAALTTGLLALLVAASAAPARPQATITLKGAVGPGYTISVTKAGKKVTKLEAGRYRFVISDRASIHDFVLEKEKGAGRFEKNLTGLARTGTRTVVVKLTRGKWKYYCEPHESMMFGFFTVQ